ncbi:MAG: GDP-mannose 4,6-dehydratase [Myxococcales bacterium]|nr:GDP-mannose 4,6-dehydratase [Myxococcales bacterium]
MQVVLTGCAGFIGSHLAKRLLDLGMSVTGIDCFDETLYPAALHREQLAPLLQHPRFRFVEGNILDVDLLDALTKDASAMIHLAALAGVRPSLHQAARYMRYNVEGTQNILSACQRSGISRIVFASSSSVYGSHCAVPFREDDPAVLPASPYAASKRAGELLCATHCDLYGGSIAALRFFTVYGPHQRPEMAIASFAARILRGETVFLHGSGESARDYTYIDDIIDGIIAALDKTSDRSLGLRCYNLGGERTTTLRKLVSILEASLGRSARIEWRPDQPGDVPVTWSSLQRSRSELGYVPKVDIEQGIHRYADWIRARLANTF